MQRSKGKGGRDVIQTRMARISAAGLISMWAAGCVAPETDDQEFATSADALCVSDPGGLSCGCVSGDSHSNLRSPSGQTNGSCAETVSGNPDNPSAGGINYAGDIDFFKYTTPGGYRTYVFRTANFTGLNDTTQ